MTKLIGISAKMGCGKTTLTHHMLNLLNDGLFDATWVKVSLGDALKKEVSEIFGFPLSVHSLPYQTQDSIVAACATTAIWVSLYALNALYGTQKSSPFEITKTSVSFPGLERNFPSTGLNIYQIKNYFNSIGMETEFINVEMAPTFVRKDIVSDAVKAYLSIGLPVIACIKLINEHGSATILRERISLAEDKYSSLEEKDHSGQR